MIISRLAATAQDKTGAHGHPRGARPGSRAGGRKTDRSPGSTRNRADPVRILPVVNATGEVTCWFAADHPMALSPEPSPQLGDPQRCCLRTRTAKQSQPIHCIRCKAGLIIDRVPWRFFPCSRGTVHATERILFRLKRLSSSCLHSLYPLILSSLELSSLRKITIQQPRRQAPATLPFGSYRVG